MRREPGLSAVDRHVTMHHAEPDWESALSPFPLIDEAMPVMLAYIDSSQRCRYHNRAYRDWLGLDAAEINGRTMLEVFGEAMYAQTEIRLREAFSGRAVRYERTQKRRDGGTERVFAHLVPRIESGRVLGVYAILVSLTRSAAGEGFQPENKLPVSEPEAAEPGATARIGQAQELYEAAIDAELTGWENAADRIKAAIRDDEFEVFVQPVKDLQSETQSCYEIFLRMTEEEENMMPPGAFFLLAEKHGLMAELDQWTVTNALKAIVARKQAAPTSPLGTFCISLSKATISDPCFPDFVRSKLMLYDVPGEALRFQVQQADVLANPADASHLVQELARLDCWSILGGFGRDKVSFDILKDLPVGFLKIDSSIILRLEREDESALAMVKSVTRVAHTVGINTIAEFVETPQMVLLLRDIGVDYAQGLIIGQPIPIAEAA